MQLGSSRGGLSAASPARNKKSGGKGATSAGFGVRGMRRPSHEVTAEHKVLNYDCQFDNNDINTLVRTR